MRFNKSTRRFLPLSLATNSWSIYHIFLLFIPGAWYEKFRIIQLLPYRYKIIRFSHQKEAKRANFYRVDAPSHRETHWQCGTGCRRSIRMTFPRCRLAVVIETRYCDHAHKVHARVYGVCVCVCARVCVCKCVAFFGIRTSIASRALSRSVASRLLSSKSSECFAANL